MAAKKAKKDQVLEAPVLETYDKSEFIKASRQLFGVPSECVVAALREIEEPITFEKAKKIVNAFMNMEVK